MKMFLLSFLRFELRRILFNRRNMLLFIMIFLGSVYLVITGVMEYKKIEKERENFQLFEREKVQLYIDYSQYGGYGFQVFFMPGPMYVFFNNTRVLGDITCNIDTMQIINVQQSFKGRNLFPKKGFLKDFSNVHFYFGSLFMLFLGASLFVSPGHVRLMLAQYPIRKVFFSAVASRLLILDTLILLLQALAVLIPKAMQVPFHPGDLRGYFSFSLYTLLFHNLFFFIGMLISIHFSLKRRVSLFLFITWFFLIFVIPEIEGLYISSATSLIPPNDSINIRKMQNMVNLEGQVRRSIEKSERAAEVEREQRRREAFAFMDLSYAENLVLESELNDAVKAVVRKYRYSSLLIPTVYYHFLGGGVSSMGYTAYLNFIEYIMKIQDDFMVFYMKKRYRSQDKKVEAFVRGNENVYTGKTDTPAGYWMSILIIALYSGIMLAGSFRKMTAAKVR